MAISNHRILALENGQVTFTYKNYSAHGQRQRMTPDAHEFIRRFLLHVLPKGFTRIRHFGLCAGRQIRTKWEVARALLTTAPTTAPQQSTPANVLADHRPWWKRLLDRTGVDVMAWPHCDDGRFVRRHKLPPSSGNLMSRFQWSVLHSDTS